MKIGVLPIGKTDTATIIWIKENLAKAFPNAKCVVVDDNLPLRKEAFDENRKQYNSHISGRHRLLYVQPFIELIVVPH